jgi:hypothetical protein
MTFGVPKCFGSDIMHLLSLNLPDLLIPLWRGTFECNSDDDKASWDWATLSKLSDWKMHGETVAATTVHIPGSFGHPPRNPAEKINSGYKAWEFHLYLYGLGPGLLYGILPDVYWQHFCKLVRAVRIISQHTITRHDLQNANRLSIEFIKDFEHLYYQCCIERIHFVRQSIHALGHYGREVELKGPLICASQLEWTMERTIGNLTEEIRQHSSPYANLTQRAIRQAQINALKAIIPSLEPDKPATPRWSLDIGNGYFLLPHHERTRHEARQPESEAIRAYLIQHAPDSPDFKFFSAQGLFRLFRWTPSGKLVFAIFVFRCI